MAANAYSAPHQRSMPITLTHVPGEVTPPARTYSRHARTCNTQKGAKTTEEYLKWRRKKETKYNDDKKPGTN